MLTIIRGRSLGLKLLLLGVIVVMLGIPLGLISLLSWERSARASDAVSEVATIYGGAQTVRGPFLVLPFTTTSTRARYAEGQRHDETVETPGTLIVSADELDISADQTVIQRHRGIYSIPVYDTQVTYQARFAMDAAPAGLPDGAVVDWTQASLVFGFSDLRSINAALAVDVDGPSTAGAIEPGSVLDSLGWRGVTVALGQARPGQPMTVNAQVSLTGASGLRFVPAGRETRVSMQSDWPHPGFQGGFLPVSREISETGYSAHWTIPYLARGVPGSWPASDRAAASLDPVAFGVDLVTPANGYQQVGRALKYALFFIGLILLMLFLIEANSGNRIHPAQYVLAGMAQVIFYLLLLAISEHASVALAFFVAMAATLGLTGFYAMTVFQDRRMGWVTTAAMGLVYATQYVLILMEDFALLIGSLLAFAGLAATMIVTRRIDWYNTASPPEQA